jgi:hypothetical protein
VEICELSYYIKMTNKHVFSSTNWNRVPSWNLNNLTTPLTSFLCDLKSGKTFWGSEGFHYLTKKKFKFGIYFFENRTFVTFWLDQVSSCKPESRSSGQEISSLFNKIHFIIFWASWIQSKCFVSR